MSILRIFLLAAGLSLLSSNASAIVPTTPLTHPNTQATRVVHAAGQFQTAMAFGAAVVGFMVFCRAHEKQKPWLAVSTFVFGLMAAGYGFVAGAWPLGLAVAGYSIAHLCGYIRSRRSKPEKLHPRLRIQPASRSWEESRMSRMFG